MVFSSFIVPVYNTRPEILEKTIKDLYMQTSLPIYVINDASSKKETIECLNKLERYGLIQVIHHEKNKGKIEALATGVKEGNVTYPFFIDDDVIIRINHINYKVESLDDVVKEEIYILSQSEESCCVVYPVGARNKNKSIITRIQDLEHIISTYYIRKLLGGGLFVNGTGSLWKADEFWRIYELHSKLHEADDLETSLIIYKLRREIIFSDKLFLLAEMKENFKEWFIQRLSWEYSKWRLIRSYWKEIIAAPNDVLYYFASISLLLSFVHNISAIIFSIALLSSILANNRFRRPIRRKVKETIIYMPYIGLLANVYPPILLVAPFYYYMLLNTIRKKYSIQHKKISLNNILQLLVYTSFYLLILQPAGLAYRVYRGIRKRWSL